LTIAGIDVGSRYIKYAVLHKGVPRFLREETGYDPLAVCRRLIGDSAPDRVLATGYGRHLLAADKHMDTITEIKAVARGAREVFPSCRTIIDIGGQDTKVVLLKADGTIGNFEMNDRCAAGTGKFLEIMARALGFSLDDFGLRCETSQQVNISSLCAVFAESEVITLIGKGVRREVIATALHNSIVTRILPLVKRVGLVEEIVFAGGCARDACLQRMLTERLGMSVLIYDQPDMLSAYGAALCALDEIKSPIRKASLSP
jgi:predicted CoA-substrate-specific enzyme activase